MSPPAVGTVDVGDQETGQEVEDKEDAEPHQPLRATVLVPDLALPSLGAVPVPARQTALSVREEGERQRLALSPCLAVGGAGSSRVRGEVRGAGQSSVLRTDTGSALTSLTGPAGLLTRSAVREAGWDGTDGIPASALSSPAAVCGGGAGDGGGEIVTGGVTAESLGGRALG